MHTNIKFSDAEVAAAIDALASIATGDTPVSTAAERHLLRQALAAIDAAEVAAGLEVLG
jgi:hypothetical protein